MASPATFGYWTFNGKVPGNHLRPRPGDTIDIHLKIPPTRHDPPWTSRRPSWPRRRRRLAAGGSGRGKIDDVEGADARALRLPLRDAHGRRAHRQRYVRHDPGRAGRRPAAGRPRILRHAGRDPFGHRLRTARQRRVQRRQAARGEAGILRVQRLSRRFDQAASAACEGRRYGADLLRRGRSELRPSFT